MTREQALTRLQELWPEATNFQVSAPDDGEDGYIVSAQFEDGSERWGTGESWQEAIDRADNQEPSS